MQNVLHFKLPRTHLTWIGVNDIGTEGVFVYDSNKELTKFTSWRSVQPDNAYKGEDCVEMFYLDELGWNDRSCTHPKRFLCET